MTDGRFCLDNGGKLLTVNDADMNGWVQDWMNGQGLKEIGLGLRRNLLLKAETQSAGKGRKL